MILYLILGRTFFKWWSTSEWINKQIKERRRRKKKEKRKKKFCKKWLRMWIQRLEKCHPTSCNWYVIETNAHCRRHSNPKHRIIFKSSNFFMPSACRAMPFMFHDYLHMCEWVCLHHFIISSSRFLSDGKYFRNVMRLLFISATRYKNWQNLSGKYWKLGDTALFACENNQPRHKNMNQ